MTRVALFIRSLHVGGAEKQSILLAKALSRYFDARLVVFYPEGEMLDQARQEIDKGSLVFLQGQGIPGRLLSLYRYLRNEKIDVLINYLPLNNITGAVAGRLAGVPVIFGGVRSTKPVRGMIRSAGQKFVLNHLVDGIIANNSRAVQAYSESGYRTGKMHVIHNGIDAGVEKIDRADRSPITILSVGRFISEKDYLTAIRAVSRLCQSDSHRPIRYLIAGYGPERRSILRMIDEEGMIGAIEVLDRPVDIGMLYRRADIFLMTSVHEGMPNALMEAMAYSLPVVSTDTGDVSQLVKDGANGFLRQAADVIGISDSIGALAESAELRNRYGAEGKRIISEQFSVKRLAHSHASLICGHLGVPLPEPAESP